MFGSRNSRPSENLHPRGIPDEKPRSPCVALCNIDPVSGLCEGCLRTLDEISAWRFMPAEEKNMVLEKLKDRNISGPDDPTATGSPTRT